MIISSIPLARFHVPLGSIFPLFRVDSGLVY